MANKIYDDAEISKRRPGTIALAAQIKRLHNEAKPGAFDGLFGARSVFRLASAPGWTNPLRAAKILSQR
jgi:hypothetical protein